MERVNIEWRHPATKVSVRGSWDFWDEEIELTRHDDYFSVNLDLPPGRYSYKYVVDGNWFYEVSQPTEADEAGNINNVVILGSMKSHITPKNSDEESLAVPHVSSEPTQSNLNPEVHESGTTQTTESNQTSQVQQEALQKPKEQEQIPKAHLETAIPLSQEQIPKAHLETEIPLSQKPNQKAEKESEAPVVKLGTEVPLSQTPNESESKAKTVKPKVVKPKTAAVLVDVSGVKERWEELRKDSSSHNFFSFSFENKSLEFIKQGTGGLSEIKQLLKDDNIVFSALKVIARDGVSTRDKFVLIPWVGKDAKPLSRARVSTLVPLFRDECAGHHVAVPTATTEEDLTSERIIDLIKKSGGAHVPSEFKF